MNNDHDHYQEGRIIWSWWKFAIQKSTDGAGTVWIVIRLLDGKEDDRQFIDMTEWFQND